MTRQLAELFCAVAEDRGYAAGPAYGTMVINPSYSGRGMMGHSTYALEVKDWRVLVIAAVHFHKYQELMDEAECHETLATQIAELRTDALGNNIVVY